MNRRRNRPIGPWHLHVWEPAKWVQIKKKEITGLVTYKKVEFCPHCGDKLTVSRDWGIAIAEVTHAVSGGLAKCKGCGQHFTVLPRFLKVPGLKGG